MKRLMTFGFALASLAFIGAPQQAHAQRVTAMKAGHLAELCHSPQGKGSCDAYLAGVADGVSFGDRNAINRGDKNVPMPFCINKQATTAEMRNNYLKWAKAHKDRLGLPVGEGAFFAFHEAYPCHS